MPEQPNQPQPSITGGAWCLIGSARFEQEFHDWAKYLAFAGFPCFTLAVFPSQAGQRDWYTPNQKAMLDFVHQRKIIMSQSVLVLNKGGYVGESTLREMLFALELRKAIFSIEPMKNKETDLAARIQPFPIYLENAPREIFAVVGRDTEEHVMKAFPKDEPEVRLRKKGG